LEFFATIDPLPPGPPVPRALLAHAINMSSSKNDSLDHLLAAALAARDKLQSEQQELEYNARLQASPRLTNSERASKKQCLPVALGPHVPANAPVTFKDTVTVLFPVGSAGLPDKAFTMHINLFNDTQKWFNHFGAEQEKQQMCLCV
jgi:hypothetical protein